MEGYCSVCGKPGATVIMRQEGGTMAALVHPQCAGAVGIGVRWTAKLGVERDAAKRAALLKGRRRRKG